MEVIIRPNHHPHHTMLTPPPAPPPLTIEQSTDAHVRAYLLRVLEFTHGNRVRAAQIAGVHRSQLYLLMRKHGVQVPSNYWRDHQQRYSPQHTQQHHTHEAQAEDTPAESDSAQAEPSTRTAKPGRITW